MAKRFKITEAGKEAGWVWMHRGGWVLNPESRYAADYEAVDETQLQQACDRGEFEIEHGEMVHVGGIMYDWQPKETPLTTGKHVRCWKCSGTGYLTWTGIDNGRCWQCNATGKVAAQQFTGRNKGVFAFAVKGLAWCFETIHHSEHAHSVQDPTECTPHSISVRCWAAGDDRYTGTTLLSCRLSVEHGRKVWRAAADGMRPEDMTAEFLGVEEPSCAISRNIAGIEVADWD